mmetsp:Transcript_4566/g.11491  ORF Transcript_4566/g.11491 Transcript_4566/m.11491 type:complete len:253 (-) Transcript_4566:1095-1853(-)
MLRVGLGLEVSRDVDLHLRRHCPLLVDCNARDVHLQRVRSEGVLELYLEDNVTHFCVLEIRHCDLAVLGRVFHLEGPRREHFEQLHVIAVDADVDLDARSCALGHVLPEGRREVDAVLKEGVLPAEPLGHGVQILGVVIVVREAMDHDLEGLLAALDLVESLLQMVAQLLGLTYPSYGAPVRHERDHDERKLVWEVHVLDDGVERALEPRLDVGRRVHVEHLVDGAQRRRLVLHGQLRRKHHVRLRRKPHNA